jgi:diguanylate cyclase (GGDEF)-like protein
MTVKPDQMTITPFYSRAEELVLPVSTYVISGGSRLVIVDPGPAWHIREHIDAITALVTGQTPVVVVVQSPDPGAFDGLRLLANLSEKRSVIIHWKVASGAGDALEGWRVQTLTTKAAGLPVSPGAKLTIGISSYAGAPGSLMSFESSTGTLFSGPFLGSLGPGKDTGIPALRRESVRAYRDVLTPTMASDIIETTFGSDVAVNQIAPTHGRLAVGGTSLIRALFRDDVEGKSVPRALYHLFVRTAALIGGDAAAGIYRATGVPVPKIDSGYRTLPGGEVAGLAENHWTKILEAVEQWVPGSALTSLFPLAAELTERHNLPVSRTLQRFARAARRPRDPAPVVSDANAPEAADAPARAIGTPDMPGTSAGGPGDGTDDLTDPVTGLMNETVFKQRLAGQFNAGAEAEGLGALILLGVDNIRRINTTYGRKGGDEALYTIAYLLRNFQSANSRRGTHRLYKMTGPTFGYVLSQGSMAEGADVGDRIRRSIAESAMFLEQLTVSVGVVGLDEVSQPTNQEDGGQALADEAASRGFARMRIAQQGGANTVCSTDPAGASVISGGSTVLVADPDAPYLEMLTKQLEDHGYTVLLAGDGAEASNIIDQIVPDAIVAEVMLPKKNGFALREELRHTASLSQIPFILVSHRKTDETIEKAAMLGIVHFLAKPFSLVELTGLLRNLTSDTAGVSGGTA